MKEPFPSQNKFTGCVLFQATAKYTLSKGSEPERVKERKLNTGKKKKKLSSGSPYKNGTSFSDHPSQGGSQWLWREKARTLSLASAHRCLLRSPREQQRGFTGFTSCSGAGRDDLLPGSLLFLKRLSEVQCRDPAQGHGHVLCH